MTTTDFDPRLLEKKLEKQMKKIQKQMEKEKQRIEERKQEKAERKRKKADGVLGKFFFHKSSFWKFFSC